jgi:hypothetical protein
MNALKAQWVVTAGLIAGEEPMHEYTKIWSYDSQDWEDDGNTRGNTFNHMAREAQAWAGKLQMGSLNWVHVEYIWM